MIELVRREIQISTEQNDFLQRRARELGVTEDELVRRAIATLSSKPEPGPSRFDAWRHLKSAMEDRAQMDVPQSGRTWTRDELYDADDRG